MEIIMFNFTDKAKIKTSIRKLNDSKLEVRSDAVRTLKDFAEKSWDTRSLIGEVGGIRGLMGLLVDIDANLKLAVLDTIMILIGGNNLPAHDGNQTLFAEQGGIIIFIGMLKDSSSVQREAVIKTLLSINKTLMGNNGGITALVELLNETDQSLIKMVLIALLTIVAGHSANQVMLQTSSALIKLTRLRSSEINEELLKLVHNLIAYSSPSVTLSGHTNSVDVLLASDMGSDFISGSADNTMRVWDLTNHSSINELLGHSEQITALTLLPNFLLASGSADKSIKLWDRRTGICEMTLTGHTKSITALLALPDGRLASGSYDGYLKLWNISTRTCEATLLQDSTRNVRTLTMLSNGYLVNSWNDDLNFVSGGLCVWDLSTNWCVKELVKGGIVAIAGLSNNHLAVGTTDNIYLFNLVSQQEMSRFVQHHNGLGKINSLTVLSDGRLVSGHENNEIKIWDITNPNEPRCEVALLSHAGPVKALVQLVDGRLASGSSDNLIKIWDLGIRLAPTSSVNTILPGTVVVSNPIHMESPISHAVSIVQETSQLSAPTAIKIPLTSTSIRHPLFTGATTMESCISERGYLQELSELSLSPTVSTIAFSELELREELGRGVFGVVSEALWQGTTRVAVKQFHVRLTTDLEKEFQREMNVYARLRHPNIIALYGICIESMKYSVVMEFMADGSLNDVLRSPAELCWSLRLSIALDFVSGLLYLHTQHIIHHDLKSLNILVDDRMRAKISYFGLSKMKPTITSMTKGGGETPHWMAPELFDEAANSFTTDVYASGIVFWEIAARKLPYEGKNHSQIMRFVEKGNRETIPEGTPPQFATLITRCWAQRAEDRPIIAEVARELLSASSMDAAMRHQLSTPGK